MNIRYAIRYRLGNLKFPTWYRGQEKIDSIWTSEEIQVDSMTYIPFYLSIRDHRSIVMEISEESLLDNKMIKGMWKIAVKGLQEGVRGYRKGGEPHTAKLPQALRNEDPDLICYISVSI